MIELMIYIAVAAVIFGLCASLYFRALTHTARLSRTGDDIVRALNAGEAWRQDMRAAIGQPQLLRAPSEEAIHIPQASGEIIYLFSQGAVRRRERPEQPWTIALTGVKNSRIQKDIREKVVSWRWELELEPRRKKVRLRPLFTFQAVAQGDRQP